MEFLARSLSKGGFLCVLTGLLALSPAGAMADLTAGDVDDNLNFELYLKYEALPLGPGNWSTMPDLNLSDRVTLRILDGQGEPLSSAWVRLSAEDAPEVGVELQAGADGVVRFFPTFDGLGGIGDFTVEAKSAGDQGAAAQTSLALADLDARRELSVTVPGADASLPTALDIMLVIDTTGSMDDEIRYLATEFSSITGAIAQSHDGLDIRYGLIVYRDTGDEYTTKSYGFTADIETMQSWLTPLDGSGGGDYPEAMDRALWQAVDESWRGGNTARLLFLVADAPPHQGGYLATILAAQAARSAGIHIFPLAASGVDTAAEYLMRAAAVLTQGRYLFLTDDSGIGNGHAEPSAQCYVVTTLTNLFGRVIGGELSGERIEPAQADILRTVGNYTAGKCEETAAVIRPYAVITRQTTSPGGLEPAPSLPKGGEPGAGTGAGAETTGDASTGATPSGSTEPVVYADAELTTGGGAVVTADMVYSDSMTVAREQPLGAPPVESTQSIEAPPTDAVGATAKDPGASARVRTAASISVEIAAGATAIGLAVLIGAMAGQRDMATRKRVLEMWKRG